MYISGIFFCQSKNILANKMSNCYHELMTQVNYPGDWPLYHLYFANYPEDWPSYETKAISLEQWPIHKTEMLKNGWEYIIKEIEKMVYARKYISGNPELPEFIERYYPTPQLLEKRTKWLT